MDVVMKQHELLIAFNDSSFVIKTQQQLLRDFNLAGLALNGIDPEVPQTHELICKHLISTVAYGIQHDFSTLTNLFYILDLPQQLVDTIIASDQSTEKLAELILARAAFKVFLKQKFSGE